MDPYTSLGLPGSKVTQLRCYTCRPEPWLHVEMRRLVSPSGGDDGGEIAVGLAGLYLRKVVVD